MVRTSLRSVACLPSGIVSKTEARDLVLAQPYHELLDFQFR